MKLSLSAVTSLVSVRSFLKSRPNLSVDLSWLLYELRGVLADLEIECLEGDRLVRCFRELETMRDDAAKRGHCRIAAKADSAIADLHTASLYHGGYIMLDGMRYGVWFQNVWRTVVFCNAAAYIVVGRYDDGLSVIRQDTYNRHLRDAADAEERATVLAVIAESRKVYAMHANQA